jgi:hypothetical protein
MPAGWERRVVRGFMTIEVTSLSSYMNLEALKD